MNIPHDGREGTINSTLSFKCDVPFDNTYQIIQKIKYKKKHLGISFLKVIPNSYLYGESEESK